MSAIRLAIVVDTEEEFDWRKPFDRDSRGVSSIPAQARAHEIFDEFSVVPTYVIDHPVAATPSSAAFLRGLADAGRAEIGAHLHPWVNPPFDEEVTTFNSYHGNLPRELERAKIAALTAAIADGIGKAPTVFKAGRYGFGPNTAGLLIEAGYTVDCSFVPHADFRGDGGPDFHGTSERPFWLDSDRVLLEIPLTSGHIGRFRRAGPALGRLFDSPAAARLRIPGILARAGLVARSRLTPEGVPVAEQKALIRAMAADGVEQFTLAYHSPSLEPGHTPYVNDKNDLAKFLADLRELLRFVRDDVGGTFNSLAAFRANAAFQPFPVHPRP